MSKKTKKTEAPARPSLTADLEFNEIELAAFNAVGDGSLKIETLDPMKGSGKVFSLTFTKNGIKHNFCLHGFNAKKLAAYIALWA